MMRVLWVAVAVVVSGCAGLLPAPTPMAKVVQEAPGEPRCILVLLPGAGDRADDYVKAGFVQRVKDTGLPVLVAAADATLGYYFQNSMQVRVETDVVKPLRAQHPGAALWVAGISMGGFGSLFYTMEHADQVQGVLAMAPFLGDAAIADEVRAAGGLSKWRAPAKEATNNGNYQRQLWRWLKEATEPGAKGPQIHLGYGVDDGLSVQGAMLANALPSGRVTLAPGGHVWSAWTPIFETFLKSPEFVKACGPAQ